SIVALPSTVRHTGNKWDVPKSGKDCARGGMTIRESVAHYPDTPLRLKPSGFSVQRPSHCRDSPQALFAPENVLGRVLNTIQHASAVRMRRGCARAWTAACARQRLNSPARVRGVDRCHALAGAGCLASENRQKVAPPSVVKAFVTSGLAVGSVVLVVAVL